MAEVETRKQEKSEIEDSIGTNSPSNVGNERDMFVASVAVSSQSSNQNKADIKENTAIPLEQLKPELVANVLKDRSGNLGDTSIPHSEKNEFLAQLDDKRSLSESSDSDTKAKEEEEEEKQSNAFLEQLIKDLSSKPEYQYNVDSFDKFVSDGSKNAVFSGKNRDSSRPIKIKDFVTEFFFGDYYCNTSLMLFTCLWSYYLAKWNFSYMYLLIIWFFVASTYKKSIRRLNRDLKDDIKRIHINETLSDKVETINWLNQFLAKFWVIYMPVLSQQVKDVVNPTLEDVTPGYGIDALTLDEFTLGTKAPTIDTIKSYTKKGKDIIEMDWKISFTPNDTSNMTSNEIKRKVNPKIALGITVGKGFISKSLPVLVENINVGAHAKVTIQLNDNFPNIKIVSISLLEKLLIDFALKPVGGDTLGLDIMSFLPGLKTFVTTMINAGVGPMLYAPNKLDIDVEEIIENAVNDAMGCLAITIDDFKPKLDVINSSLNVPLNMDYSFLTLKTSSPGFNGVENEHCVDLKEANSDKPKIVYIPVNTLDQEITLEVSSYHENLSEEHVLSRRKNIKNKKAHKIGSFTIPIGYLEEQNEGKGYSSEVTTKKLYKSGKKNNSEPSVGTLSYKIHWITLDESRSTANSDGSNGKKSDHKTTEYVINGAVGDDIEDEDEDEKSKDSSVATAGIVKNGPGILKLTLQEVTNLLPSVAPFGQLNPLAILSVDGKTAHTFRQLKRINEPSWNDIVELIIPSKKSSLIKIEIFDHQFGKNILLCSYSGTVSEYLSKWLSEDYLFPASCPASLISEFPDASKLTPVIRSKGIWKPFSIDNSLVKTLFLSEEKDNTLEGSLDTLAKIDYIGALRVYVKSCDLKNSDLSGVGDIDPYITISAASHIKYKSAYFSDNKKPVFDSVVWIPIKKESDNCIISVYDYQNVGKDRFFGSTSFSASKYISKDVQGNYVPHLGSDKLFNLKLRDTHGKTQKSIITVSLSFVPVENVFTPTEYPLVSLWENKLKEIEESVNEEQKQLKEEMQKNPSDYELVPLTDVATDNLYLKKLESKKFLSLDDILTHNSGVLGIEVNNVKTKGSYHLQVLVDDMSYPSVVSYKAANGSIPLVSGSAFIRDLQNSRLGFRLTNKATVKSKENVNDSWYVPTKDILIKSCSGSGAGVSIQSPTGSCSFILKIFLFPTVVTLPSTETIFDTGELGLEIINATDVPSHDRNGKSDPFVQVMVNNTKLYETAVVKKTLDPTWNEAAKVKIPSRNRSNLTLLVYDWDRLGDNDLLSTAVFPLNQLAIDGSSQEWSLQLAPKGILNLKTKFAAKYNDPVIAADSGGLSAVPLETLSSVAGLGAGVASAGIGAGVSTLGKGSKLIKRGLIGDRRAPVSKDINDETIAVKKNAAMPPNTSSLAQTQRGQRVASEASEAPSRLSYDASVPNQSYASVRGNSLSHERASQTVAPKLLKPGVDYRGKVNVISCHSLGNSVQLRLYLKQEKGSIATLHKTETRRADKNGDAFFGDVVPFKSKTNNILLVEAYGKHTFGKDTELGFAQVSLSDPQILEQGQTLLRIANGNVIVDIQYGL